MARVLPRNLAPLRGYASAAGASHPSPPGTCSLTLAVRAGSRYEPKAGLAHALKTFAFKSNASGSALKIARESELYGAQLTATLTREHLLLSARFLKGDEGHFLALMASVLSSTHFYPHEYAELVVPTLRTESAAAQTSSLTAALEAAHALAFRRGLGNSLYASPFTPVSAAEVKAFAQQAFAKSNVTLISNGVSSEQASSVFGSDLKFGKSPFGSQSTSYFGGEARIPVSEETHPTMILAYGSTSAPTAAQKVLPFILGGAPCTKWGNSVGVLKGADVAVQTELLSYSDASLLTIALSDASNEKLVAAARHIAPSLSSISPSKEQLEGAKKQALMAEAAKAETLQGQVELAIGGQPGKIESVTADDVKKAYRDFISSKPTVVAVGDLGVLPYADELGLHGK